jgi:hypothetical protein
MFVRDITLSPLEFLVMGFEFNAEFFSVSEGMLVCVLQMEGLFYKLRL